LFHIPDTFAPEDDTIPPKYSAFQRVNLKLTGENKAVAKNVGVSDVLDGLINEKRDAHNKALRAIMQSYVAFDVFMDALKDSKPDYAALFSNHVAGTMHRYWKYAFPEDFGYILKPTAFDQFHSQSILKAMDIFDRQLGAIEKFAENNGYDVVVCSSMGQEAVERGEYIPELKLDNEARLANALGFAGAFKMNLAMQPDVALQFESVDDLNCFKDLLRCLVDADGKQVLVQRYEEQGTTLNLSTARSLAAAKDGKLFVDGRSFSLDELGFSLIERDQGTGYHQPEGILLWNGPSQPSMSGRQVVDSRQYAPTLLTVLGVTPPDYMMEPVR
jgi:predicted AlkP superfamily phosphohydrolase/phosphomutase